MKLKVVINRCYGGFGLSKEAEAYIHAHAPELSAFVAERGYRDIPRGPKLLDAADQRGVLRIGPAT